MGCGGGKMADKGPRKMALGWEGAMGMPCVLS